jgi:hypothetical protein
VVEGKPGSLLVVVVEPGGVLRISRGWGSCLRNVRCSKPPPLRCWQ